MVIPLLRGGLNSCQNSHVKPFLTQDVKMSILKNKYVFFMEFASIELYIDVIHYEKRK